MALLRQRLLILFTLILSAGQLLAAEGNKATRAYNAAIVTFQDGDYPRAGLEFAQFIQRFPNSTNVPNAVLLEAQAVYEQEQYTNAITLLTENMAGAGILADKYADWIGESQFAENDFLAAADTFGSLVQSFPDSSLRLRGTVEQASAFASAGQWTNVIPLLAQTNGVFQRAAQLDPNNDLISRGRELEAQAMSIELQYPDESAVLNSINPQILTPDLYIGLQRLKYQLTMETSNFPEASTAATNLYQIAKIAGNIDLMAESIAMRADALEKMGDVGDAITIYSQNLTTNSPPGRQRQAILNIADLAIGQRQYSLPETNLAIFLMQFTNTAILTNFLGRFANPPAIDMGLLSLAELQLKDHAAQPGETNLLSAAHTELDGFISTFPNNPLLGEAYLNRGWCFWLEQKLLESLPDFQAAANLLPPSEDLAVAIFKTGDAEFASTNYPAAITNYYTVLNEFTNYPAVRQELEEPALYQILRASLEVTNLTDASYALAQIEAHHPLGELAPGSELLYGENLADSGHPAVARAKFQKFAQEFPNSPLRPEADFAIARCYELENNWTNAIAAYQNWLGNYPTNRSRPQALYALALVNFQAGNESNAFVLFTNFVGQYTNNSLAPDAQWWIADHFFRLGDTNYLEAEENYEFVYQNFPTSRLAYPAQYMAGCAAAAREDFSEAIGHYSQVETILETNTDSPELLARTLLANGKALMDMPSSDTNNPLANFKPARDVFTQLNQRNPTNEFGALGWFYMGNCDLQLTNFDAATNDYAQVLSADVIASVSTRSMAQVGLGQALEKMAALATCTNQTALLQLAEDNYLDVFYEYNLRDGETADPYWTKQAGLKALPLMETLGAGNPIKTGKFIDRMEYWLPALKDSFEKMRASTLSPKS
ncbi:MAG TPA: tetratricopeptide repeat protein [Verrucomicrobiae bacterium]|jgi:TolA-binding protein